MTSSTLTIPESILLLALHDDKGEKQGTFVEYALAGAALAELLLQGRLSESGKTLDIANSTPVGDAFLDHCLAAVAAKGGGKDAKTYVQHIAGQKELLALLYEGLVKRGILDEQTIKVLWIFNQTVWPEKNPKPERELEARLRHAIAGAGTVDAYDGAIIAIAHHVDILKHNFDADTLKRSKDRIKRIVDGELLPAHATKETIQAMAAAVTIAAVMPAIMVTTVIT